MPACKDGRAAGGENDFVVIDGAAAVGRIYREMIHGEPRWMWFVQQIPEAGPGGPIPPPNQGMADSLDEAKAAFKARYQQLREAN